MSSYICPGVWGCRLGYTFFPFDICTNYRCKNCLSSRWYDMPFFDSQGHFVVSVGQLFTIRFKDIINKIQIILHFQYYVKSVNEILVMHSEHAKLNWCNSLLRLKGLRCVFEIFHDNILRIKDRKFLLIVFFNYYL